MSLSVSELDAEVGMVLPSRDTMSRFTFIHVRIHTNVAVVYAPSSATAITSGVVSIGNNTVAEAGSSVSIVQY
jgi:hypothetical protein